MDREKKEELVTFLKGVFTGKNVVIVAHYAGLSVAEMSKLRTEMSSAGGFVKVAKNRLVKLALQGTEVEHIVELFKGQTVIAYSEDPVAAPKVANDFAKSNENLVILGGALGSKFLDADGVKALAKLPSLDELRAGLVGMLNTPATRIAQITNAPASQLARVVNAHATQEQAA